MQGHSRDLLKRKPNKVDNCLIYFFIQNNGILDTVITKVLYQDLAFEQKT